MCVFSTDTTISPNICLNIINKSLDILFPFKKCPGYTKNTFGEYISLEDTFGTNLIIFQNEETVTHYSMSVKRKYEQRKISSSFPLYFLPSPEFATLIICLYDLQWHEIWSNLKRKRNYMRKSCKQLFICWQIHFVISKRNFK